MKILPNSFPDLKLPQISSKSKSSWHQFVVRCSMRNDFQNKLFSNEISTIIHYPIPPHLQNAYKSLNYKKGKFPIAEKLANDVLSLPIGIHINEKILKKSIFSTKN